MRPDVPRANALRRLPGFDAVLRIATRLPAPVSGSTELLAIGSASYEPWHLVAHLHDVAQWGGSVLPPPVLVRHAVPAGAPPHLSVGLSRLATIGRSGTVLLVTPDDVDERTLERLADARRRGGTVLAVSSGEAATSAADLTDVAQDLALVTPAHFDVAQHVLPAAAVRECGAPTAGLRAASRWRPFRSGR
jgi:hypothetical protein